MKEPEAPATPAGPRFTGAGTVLPRPGEPKGWKLKAGPAYFDSKTLYEVINGAAASYMAYGFAELARAEYTPAGSKLKEDVVVEAYRMRSPLAAYGKYSEERGSCDPVARVPGPGCSRGSDRILHKGDWFVRVTTYDDTPVAQLELLSFSDVVFGRAPGAVLVPPEAERLPVKGRKPNSVLYKPKDLLGVAALGDGFSADYLVGVDEFSLFVKRKTDEKAAKATLAALRKVAGQAGFARPDAKLESVEGVGDDAMAVETNYGWVVAARRGAEVAGGVELDSKDSGLAQVRRLLPAK